MYVPVPYANANLSKAFVSSNLLYSTWQFVNKYFQARLLSTRWMQVIQTLKTHGTKMRSRIAKPARDDLLELESVPKVPPGFWNFRSRLKMAELRSAQGFIQGARYRYTNIQNTVDNPNNF